MPLNLSKKDEGAKNMWGNWASFYKLIGGLGENAGEQGEIGQAGGAMAGPGETMAGPAESAARPPA